ncbi:hypothetical protein Tco_0626901 [Tanacetum coccineum]|uniref:Uncharacterized protein n=1 Tax=Tanacetum coccineum TaxID=301880 RepID=A0ABQ4WKY7_9ASTR
MEEKSARACGALNKDQTYGARKLDFEIGLELPEVLLSGIPGGRISLATIGVGLPSSKQSQPSIFICASLISSWSLDELWEMEDCQGGKVGGIRVLVESGKGYYPLGNMGLAG